MMAKSKKMLDEPSEIETLLPWHAAGTLNRRDAQRVEQALANDNELASRYEMVREELGEAIVTNLQKVRVDEEDETEELASLSDAAEALRLTAAAPPRPTPSGSDYE